MALATIDGLKVVKTNKHSVTVFYKGDEHKLNKYGVMCKVNRSIPNEVYYHFSAVDGKIQDQIRDSLTIHKAWSGREYVYYYKF